MAQVRRNASGKGPRTLKKTKSSIAKAKVKRPRRLTPLEIAMNNITVPVSVYDDATIKDLEHYPFSLQGKIHKQVHAVFRGGNNTFRPFTGRGHTFTNTAFDAKTAKGQQIQLHFKQGSLTVTLHRDDDGARVKDFQYYPDPLRRMIGSMLAKKGVKVKSPGSQKIRPGSRVSIRLLMGELGHIDVGVTPKGDLLTKHMAPGLRKAVERTYKQLISAAPPSSKVPWMGRSHVMSKKSSPTNIRNTVRSTWKSGPPARMSNTNTRKPDVSNINSGIRNAVRSQWQERYPRYTTRPRRGAAIAANRKRQQQ